MTMIDFPGAFLSAMQTRLGAEFPAFLAAMRAGGAESKALRVNPLRAGTLEAAAPYLESPVPWAAHGYYYRPETRPGASLAHFAGAFYLQEASAMSAAAVLDGASVIPFAEHIRIKPAQPAGRCGRGRAHHYGDARFSQFSDHPVEK